MIKRIERAAKYLLLFLCLVLLKDLTPAIIQDERRLFHKESQDIAEKEELSELKELPSYYDGRDYGISPVVKEQGSVGNCWAVAATTTLEASLLPDEPMVFSQQHMDEENPLSRAEEGGDYTMIMAYLAGWQGPVTEIETEDGTKEIVGKHVQEMQMLREGSIEEMKRAVYQYGAIQTSIHMDLQDFFSSSPYYNQYDYSYCYNGENEPNHDICIIGWDDDFPASSFYADTKKNGAFICQNSWGERFGDAGIFYVSYEDVMIRKNSIFYTVIEDTDNYDHLYQTDKCGWVGVIGYGDDTAYCANRFQIHSYELIQAVGFYATGRDTQYEIYVMDGSVGLEHVSLETPAAKGTLEYAGFYTIDLDTPVLVEEEKKMTVILKLTTPDTGYPIATEYIADENTKNVTIDDGDGYISHNGMIWTGTESTHSCNVCMKVYTRED